MLFLTVPVSSNLLRSWSEASLTWRRTSSSRRRRASAAWRSCWSSATSPARLKSGACSPPSFGKVSATCKRVRRWASSSRCCSKWARWKTWLQVCDWFKRCFMLIGQQVLCTQVMPTLAVALSWASKHGQRFFAAWKCCNLHFLWKRIMGRVHHIAGLKGRDAECSAACQARWETWRDTWGAGILQYCPLLRESYQMLHTLTTWPHILCQCSKHYCGWKHCGRAELCGE